MSLTVALQTATSGLMAAQSGLRTVSDNISNVNTPGYVRKVLDQKSMVVNGVGMGVRISGVERVIDGYLQTASLAAGADAARWGAYSQYLDNAQSLFGDPSEESFFFNRLDQVYSAFGAAANNPSSSLSRSQALAQVEDFLSAADRINGQLGEITRVVDTRIGADIEQANRLLQQINLLNIDISRARVVNGDSSGSENIQSQLLDQLSKLMDVKVSAQSSGGFVVRSAEGVLLAGEGAATLAYNRTDSTKGYISAIPPNSGGKAQPIQLNSGEIRGLLDLRNDKLPSVSDQLGEFVTRAMQELNSAHNASSAFPPPRTLTGRNTGLDLPTAVSGFTGTATVAITNASGVIQRRVDIDFTNGMMSIGGGPGSAFGTATFEADLSGAFAGFGSASFANGALTITATGATDGVAINEGTSQKAGRAFSAFFGLNDLVRPAGIVNYDTGLSAGDVHGFTPGEQMKLRLAQPDGKPIRDVTITVPAATNMSDLLATLNDTVSGVGLYGQYSLGTNGALVFTPQASLKASVSVIQDDTHRGTGGPSISELFGMSSVARSGRAGLFEVSSNLMSNPMAMSLAKLDLGATAGSPALRSGDGRGALALSAAGDVPVQFQAAGSLSAALMTANRYAAEFGGSLGRDAAAADTRAQSASAVQSEATSRRQSVEGVNLDEELIRLTTYQQAYAASARMVQAAKDLLDILMQM